MRMFSFERCTRVIVLSASLFTIVGIWRIRLETDASSARDSKSANDGARLVTFDRSQPERRPHRESRDRPRQAASAELLPSETVVDRADVDVSTSSWQNPFQPAYWQVSGWSFDDESMHSSAARMTAARFRRPYRSVSLSLRIEPAGAFGEFAVELGSSGTRTVTVVSLDLSGITVSANSGGDSRLVRREEFDPKLERGQPGLLTVAASGNRIQVSWNARRVLTCRQPSQQSGQEFQFALLSRSTRVQIDEMRIEGE